MSAPLSFFDWWESGTTQPSIPVNNNALRTMIGMRGAVSDSVTAQPSLSTPDDDGLWYIIPAGATGTQWSTFSENSCAIFFGGNWYEFVPSEGDMVAVECDLYCFSPSNGWAAVAGGGGGGTAWGDITGTLSSQTDLQSALDAKIGATVSIVTEGSAFTVSPGTHGGVNRYIRAGGNATFNTSQSYSAGQVFNIRATAAMSLLETGVTLTPPYGGTLDLEQDMAVTVIMTASNTGDVIGQTVAAS
jgi:hypothetical protein